MWTDNEVKAKLAEIEQAYNIIIQDKSKIKRKDWVIQFGR